MTDKAAKAADAKVTEDLDELRAEVDRLTKALAEARGTFAEDADAHAESLRESAENVAEDLSERAQEGWSELQKQISDNPVQSAIIAFGIGFVLSRLLSR
jgi:ElaB/YqjD/DUF883 family membrane-anchored ribosome-binding protein